MKFIFWNIAEKETVDNAIMDIIKYEQPDILLVAETNIKDSLFKQYDLKLIHSCAKTSFGLTKKLKLYSSLKNILPVSFYGDGEIQFLFAAMVAIAVRLTDNGAFPLANVEIKFPR